tara:strand:- start:41 stop:469 length:429 start_codon:yes stop_codon:yes gene_type:complete
MKSDKDTKILYIAKYAKMTEDLLKQSEHDRKFCERIIKQLEKGYMLTQEQLLYLEIAECKKVEGIYYNMLKKNTKMLRYAPEYEKQMIGDLRKNVQSSIDEMRGFIDELFIMKEYIEKNGNLDNFSFKKRKYIKNKYNKVTI